MGKGRKGRGKDRYKGNLSRRIVSTEKFDRERSERLMRRDHVTFTSIFDAALFLPKSLGEPEGLSLCGVQAVQLSAILHLKSLVESEVNDLCGVQAVKL